MSTTSSKPSPVTLTCPSRTLSTTSSPATVTMNCVPMCTTSPAGVCTASAGAVTSSAPSPESKYRPPAVSRTASADTSSSRELESSRNEPPSCQRSATRVSGPVASRSPSANSLRAPSGCACDRSSRQVTSSPSTSSIVASAAAVDGVPLCSQRKPTAATVNDAAGGSCERERAVPPARRRALAPLGVERRERSSFGGFARALARSDAAEHRIEIVAGLFEAVSLVHRSWRCARRLPLELEHRGVGFFERPFRSGEQRVGGLEADVQPGRDLLRGVAFDVLPFERVAVARRQPIECDLDVACALLAFDVSFGVFARRLRASRRPRAGRDDPRAGRRGLRGDRSCEPTARSRRGKWRTAK